MRCTCCNRALSDFESTRRHALTNAFLDLCNACFDEVSEDADIPVITRGDLECCEDTTSELDNLYSIEYNDVFTDVHFDE
jgi:hypothetical protein